MKGIRKAPDRGAWDIAVVIPGEVLANLMQQGHSSIELVGVGRPPVFHDLVGSVDQTCQSALNFDPLSASNIDPSCGTEEVVQVVNRGDPRGFV